MGCTLTCLPVAAADAAHPITTSTVNGEVAKRVTRLAGLDVARLPWRASQRLLQWLRAASAIFLLPLNHFLCESHIICQL